MTTSNLFNNLTPDERKITQQLTTVIQQQINESGGCIPFSRYMELALYYPGLGYYSNRLIKFGKQGDFITAPLVSDLFGQVLARQARELFGAGVAPTLLEFGAGTGKLAYDILTSIGDELSHYYILEVSADLRQVQQETLAQLPSALQAKVHWLEQLPDAFRGLILANEVLDAQACDLVQTMNGEILGVGVTCQAGQFSYSHYPLVGNLRERAQGLGLPAHDYLTEINRSSQAFVNSLAASLDCGAVLLIDYGSGASEYYHPHKTRGSLRGFYRQHVLDSVLSYPGLIDITANVEWSSIAQAGIEAGLELIGYTTQASFLLNCGLATIMAELVEQLPPQDYLQLSNQVDKLISPTEMGDRFKVCGFSKGIALECWQGFAAFDRSHTL